MRETIPWRKVQRVYIGDQSSRLDAWQRAMDFMLSFQWFAPGPPFRGLIVRTDRAEVVVTALQAATWGRNDPATASADPEWLSARLRTVTDYMASAKARGR